MDPYQGNPANDPATIMVPDDVTDEWTAAVINTPTESMCDSLAYLRSRLNQCSNNWPHPVTAWSGTQVGGGSLTLEIPPIYDATYARWLAPFVDGSSQCHVLQSFDGYQWTEFALDPTGSGTFACGGLLSRSTDGTILVVGAFTGSGNSIVIWTPAGISLGTPPSGSPGAGHWYSGGWSPGAALWVMWKGGSTAAPWSSPTGVTWTAAVTWAPPAGFTIHDRAHFIATVGGSTLFALFPSGTSVVSQLMASLDGQNWAQYPMPAFTLSGEAVIDAAYDAFTGTIYLLSGNGTATHLWASHVLGTWGLVSTIAHQCFALRANGRELVIWVALPGLGAGGSGAPIYKGRVSTNGGVSWQEMPGISSSVAPGNYFSLRASGSQFLYCNTSEYAASSFVGVPPTAVA